MGVTPAAAYAQTADPAQATLRLGPVGITPGITVSTGVDSNVLAVGDDPQGDVVTVVNPRVQVGLRAGRLILDVRNSVDYVAYGQFEEQGGLNMRNDTRLEMPLNRVRLSVFHSFLTTKQRATLEIDARARRHDTTLGAGVDIRMTPKTFLRFNASRADLAFDEAAENLGVNLAESLNRRMEVGTVAFRYQVTGATTIAMSAEGTRETFERSPIRNTESWRLAPGVEFDQRAILNGRAYVGYRRFTTPSGAAPTFGGLVALVELNSVIRERTRLGVQANRDVAYSYDVAMPHYLLSGVGASIGQRLGEKWEIVASGGKQILAYRSIDRSLPDPPVATAGPALTIRKDHVYTYGGGINYLLTDRMRLGVGADYVRRDSGLTLHGYRGTHILAHFSYGL